MPMLQLINWIFVDDVDYAITNYRYDYAFALYDSDKYPFDNEFHSIKVGNNKIAGIYKLNNK